MLSTDTNPKKIYETSCRLFKDGREDQESHSEMKVKDAKWKIFAGLTPRNVYDPEKESTKFDDLLLVADTALQCIRCVPNISCL